MQAPPLPPPIPIAPPQPPAATAHIVPPAPFGPSPSVIPGPFLLLLLLPAKPLLLFSLGARPPDTSHLPFSTNDIFATTAFILVAGSVALCLGVYPEVGGAISAWIRDGGWDWDWDVGMAWPDGWPWSRTIAPGTVGVSRTARTMGASGLGPGQVRGETARTQGALPKMEWKYDINIRRWVKVASRQVPSTQIRSTSRGVHSLASRHLTALRDAFPYYYSTYRPPLVASLLIIAFIVFLLIFPTGYILGSSYDADQSSSGSGSSGSSSKLPSWVERELRKRKDEKPKDSLKRMKGEEKKEMEAAKKKGKDELKNLLKKREGEKAILVKELKKRKMPTEGLEDKSKSKLSGSKKDKVKDEKKKDKKEEGKGKDKKAEGEDEDGEDKKESKSKKLKRILLGERNGGNKDVDKGVTQGPGWEIADPGIAEVTLAKSGMNAQKEAERLKAGG